MIDGKKLIKIFMRKGKDKLRLSTVINEIEMLEKFNALSNSEWISVDDVSKIPKEGKVYLVTYCHSSEPGSRGRSTAALFWAE